MRFSLALTAAALSFLSAEVAGFAPPAALVDKSANRRHSHNHVVGRRSQPHHRSTSSSLLQAGLINTDENAPRDMEALTTWAQAAGVGMADGVQLTTQDGQDFSVMTTQPIANGNPILFVPRDVLFSSGKAKQELQSIGNLDAALDYLTRLGATPNILAKLCLILRILVEYERGDASPWYAWLNSLPRLFFNAVSMTDFCYECLPPLAFSLSRAERVKFDNFYEVVQKLDLDFLSPETRQNKDLLKWAFNVVQTRAVGPDGGEKHVIPMADMFNHGTETEAVINMDADGNCLVSATRDIPAGSPIRVSYGTPWNPSALFATYGFLDESSPATFCKLMSIRETPELKELGMEHSRMLFYKETGDIAPEVWDVVLYDFLQTQNLEHAQAFLNAHRQGDSNTQQAIHEQYRADTCRILKKHVDDFLLNLDDLAQKGVGKDISQHPRLPLIMRHNEFVRETFLRVKARLDPMYEQVAQQQNVFQ